MNIAIDGRKKTEREWIIALLQRVGFKLVDLSSYNNTRHYLKIYDRTQQYGFVSQLAITDCPTPTLLCYSKLEFVAKLFENFKN